MAVSDSYLEYVRELLAEVPGLRTRRMFGGVGVYSGEHMFALVADDVLYLKTDATTRSAFAQAGGSPFRYARDGRHITMGFSTVPADALEMPQALAGWVDLALQASMRAKGG